MPGPIRLLTDAHVDVPGLDTAIGRALLIRASEGSVPETFRVHRTPRIVAFGRHDAVHPRFSEAVETARATGYQPIMRLAGGRAAVFHEETLAFHWTIPGFDPRSGIEARYEALTELMIGALGRVGVVAGVGELPGEYCPGRYSIHAAGRKIIGVGQRLARSASHVGGVIVVGRGDLVNLPLVPIYSQLDLEWDPAVTGSIEAAGAKASAETIIDAIVVTLSEMTGVEPDTIDEATLGLARTLANEHVL